MSRKKEVENKTRNNIFATAIDYLKRNKDLHSQSELAERMGVHGDTITNIVNYRTKVTDDIITKLQTAYECIFNLQWLRGESDIMLAEDLQKQSDSSLTEETEKEDTSEMSSLINVNALIAAKDEAIASLKREVAAKDEIIKALRGRLTDKDELLENKKNQIRMLQEQLYQLRTERDL